MEQLQEYRQCLLERIAAAADEVRAACASILDPRAPLEAGGWNLHQMVTHLRDVDKHVSGLRIRRAVAEDNPMFVNFDADAWMAEHYDPAEPLEAALDEFVGSIHKMVDWLRGLSAEAWNRVGSHPNFGARTLQWWTERSLAHIEEHLETLEKGK